MKTALLPATRIQPTLRRKIEAALDDGETLSAFIETSVRRQLELRAAQRAFIERGLAAERAAEASGDWLTPAEVLGEVRALAAGVRPAGPRRARAR